MFDYNAFFGSAGIAAKDSAIQYLDDERYDIVFLDLALTGNDPDSGFGVLDKIYQDPENYRRHGACFVISRLADPILGPNKNISRRLEKFPISIFADSTEPNNNLPWAPTRVRPKAYDEIQHIINLIADTIDRKTSTEKSHAEYFSLRYIGDLIKVTLVLITWLLCMFFFDQVISDKYPDLKGLAKVLVTSVPALLVFVVLFFKNIKLMLSFYKKI